METLRLKPRQVVEEEIENWDDGDFMLMDSGDLTRARSNTTTSRPSSRRRDSGSSHFSVRSDLESWAEEEETQVHIPGDDEKSTLDAISAAQKAGIPLPKNVPSSALMGGTIKRLGGRQIRKIIHEDWDHDLEIPDSPQGLRIKSPEQSEFPTNLRQISNTSTYKPKLTPVKGSTARLSEMMDDSAPIIQVRQSPINLDRFKDEEEDDDLFGDAGETIKVSKQRHNVKPVPMISLPTPPRNDKIKDIDDDDFEMDLELPSSGKLQLSMKRDIPKTPTTPYSDDIDWGEGSLGTRYGGTRRDGVRSARSSSTSALTPLSPSISSSMTAESEDETFDGLILPAGPVNFRERLQKLKKLQSPERVSQPAARPSPKKPYSAEADKPDFLEGLDIGDGEVFNSGKLTLNRNIKVKATSTASPVRPKAAVSLTFTTNKPAPTSRLPRLNHERAHSSPLEPVSESGGPIPQRTRRPQSRLSHSAQSSVSSIPAPSSSSPKQRYSPSASRTRDLATKSSTNSLRNEPTTTHAQLLKQKRSLPAIRAMNPPSKPSSFRYDRPPSRDRPPSAMRPKTPVEHYQRSSLAESPVPLPRRNYQPFLPGGATGSQSQHITTKSLRPFRRHDSDASMDSLRSNSRAYSRSSTIRSPSPQMRYRVAADTWERLSKPKNKKNFGDGHELDGFDDLPTSREVETRFLKQAVSMGSRQNLRKAYQTIGPERTTTPTPSMIAKPTSTTTPHFARDTAASRIARETILANRPPPSSANNGPLASINAHRGGFTSTRGGMNSQNSTLRSKRIPKRTPQLKPHLIANLGGGKESKTVNGMYYNADTFRWEGNENVLNAFDAPSSIPSAPSLASHINREKETTPRPALITQISATKGVQVVNGMVFDPQTMCWLKLGHHNNPKSESGDTMDNLHALDDEEDVFRDIPDLDDSAHKDDKGHGRSSDINDDWLVGEEFDIGPEFIRRQREEEDRWRKKCDKWAGNGLRHQDTWRWTIRDLVSQFDNLPM